MVSLGVPVLFKTRFKGNCRKCRRNIVDLGGAYPVFKAFLKGCLSFFRVHFRDSYAF